VKICVFGNSVAFRMRPPRSGPEQRTYPEWLRCDGHEVRVVARAGVLLNEAFATLDDQVITEFPDVVIVNFGIVEVCYRQTVRWINNRTITNYYLNQVFDQEFTYDTAGQRARLFLWRAVNALTRRLSAVVGLRWQWLSTDRFLQVLDETVGRILKETEARVIVLGINPCSERVERVLEGSLEEIAAANERVRAMVATHGTRASFVSPAECIASRVDELVPDGIHFSADGHRVIANALRSALRDPSHSA